MDISVTVFLCFFTVTDFSEEDKAGGVTFCAAVHQRPRQVISHFGGLCSSEAQIGRIGERTGQAHAYANITI